MVVLDPLLALLGPEQPPPSTETRSADLPGSFATIAAMRLAAASVISTVLADLAAAFMASPCFRFHTIGMKRSGASQPAAV